MRSPICWSRSTTLPSIRRSETGVTGSTTCARRCRRLPSRRTAGCVSDRDSQLDRRVPAASDASGETPPRPPPEADGDRQPPRPSSSDSRRTSVSAVGAASPGDVRTRRGASGGTGCHISGTAICLNRHPPYSAGDLLVPRSGPTVYAPPTSLVCSFGSARCCRTRSRSANSTEFSA